MNISEATKLSDEAKVLAKQKTFVLDKRDAKRDKLFIKLAEIDKEYVLEVVFQEIRTNPQHKCIYFTYEEGGFGYRPDKVYMQHLLTLVSDELKARGFKIDTLTLTPRYGEKSKYRNMQGRFTIKWE